ncbi:unnamed protein product [Lactuca saligna]|uniref:Uncharacterized protein n=1 Tax=Lactuca saligna TaxID=75948 RepID=A0AA35UW78_LACSI|nr:unnamed protein product [Lactuca saligna]
MIIVSLINHIISTKSFPEVGISVRPTCVSRNRLIISCWNQDKVIFSSNGYTKGFSHIKILVVCSICQTYSPSSSKRFIPILGISVNCPCIHYHSALHSSSDIAHSTVIEDDSLPALKISCECR